MNMFRKLFGLGPDVDYSDLVAKGAVIVDVRSKGEFASGGIKGSLNIPLDQLPNNLSRLPDKSKTVVTVCASGMRSGAAKRLLESKGYLSVYNGGSWASLQNKLTS